MLHAAFSFSSLFSYRKLQLETELTSDEFREAQKIW
jgi:hypothetical protein